MYEAIDRPDESQTKVWVNADNTDVILGDATSAKYMAYENFDCAIIAFIIGILFVPRQNKKRKMSVDNMASMYYIAIVTAVAMAFGNLFMIFLYYSSKGENSYINPAFWNLGMAFTVILGIAIVVIIRLKKKLE